MSHDRCVRSCYFALFLPSVFLSLYPALAGIPAVLSCIRRYSAVSVLFPAVFRRFFPSAVSCPAFGGIPLGLFLLAFFVTCSRRYSGVLFSSAPCGIPQAITLPIQSPHLRHLRHTCAIFLSCFRRYSAGSFPPRFLRVLFPSVFRRFW